MKKSYVDTAHGQVHVRHWAGSGTQTVLLIHWTPFSGRMYEQIAPLFAGAGYQVIAPDMLGYGRSDPRPGTWDMADWARSALDVLAAFQVDSAAVIGGHNGASIATECAIAAPDVVSRLVVDGCAILTPELRDVFKGMVKTQRPLPSRDGDMQTLVWSRVERLWQEYVPGFDVSDETVEMMWPAMLDYLETDFQTSAPVSGAYDITTRLPLVRQPSLALTAEKDTLFSTFEDTKRLLKPDQHHIFKGNHPLHFSGRVGEYAARILSFLSA
jgi:pimeloyl-ACP methyl ester carboxylesterase